jgi:hypothetical protein
MRRTVCWALLWLLPAAGGWASPSGRLPFPGPAVRAASETPPPADAVWAPTGLFAQRVLQEEPEKKKEEKKEKEREEAKSRLREAPKERSPALAFLFSAAVPGAGQFYNGNRRALVYLAVETVALVAHFSFRSSGKNKEKEYKAFADEHWSFETYRASVGDSACTGTRQWTSEADSILAYFYEHNKDHYYEDIGKLEAYACGWDSEQNRLTYRDMRGEANDLLGRARTALMVVFLNHIVSAVDAFRTARSMKMEVAPRTELKLDFAGALTNPRARVRLVHRF